MREGPVELPREWRQVNTIAVGGLTEVGFSDDEQYVLVVSSSGRGLLECQTGKRIARDSTPPAANAPWLDEANRTAVAIGPADGVPVHVVGLWGGSLPGANSRGWGVGVFHSVPLPGEQRADDPRVFLHRRPGERMWELDRGVTEVRAVGFSPGGRFLLVAKSSDLAIFECEELKEPARR